MKFSEMLSKLEELLDKKRDRGADNRVILRCSGDPEYADEFAYIVKKYVNDYSSAEEPKVVYIVGPSEYSDVENAVVFDHIATAFAYATTLSCDERFEDEIWCELWDNPTNDYLDNEEDMDFTFNIGCTIMDNNKYDSVEVFEYVDIYEGFED